jgi:hypothetical protein
VSESGPLPATTPTAQTVTWTHVVDTQTRFEVLIQTRGEKVVDALWLEVDDDGLPK